MNSLTKDDLEILILLIQNAHDEEKDNVEIDTHYLSQIEDIYQKLKLGLVTHARR